MAIDDEERPRDGNVAATATCTVVGGRSDPVGRSLVLMLLESLKWTVRITDSQPSFVIRPEEEGKKSQILSDSIRNGRASYFQVDVLDRSQLSRAIESSSVVFLMDLAETSAQNFYKSYMTIVQGTKNVLIVSRECKVERLIYKSSADVVFDGLHDIHNGNESLPYPHKFRDMLNDLKAQAEAVVLFGNGKGGLLTCALRPSSPFGPGDVNLVKFLVDAAKSGTSEFIIGSDKTIGDYTYVENVAHAHVLAEKALCSEISSIGGKPFFITNLESMKHTEFMSHILEGLGFQRPRIHLPVRLIFFLVTLMEWAHGKLQLHRNSISCFTPSIIRSLSCTKTFDCSKAQKILGYSPVVPLEEGIMLTVESFSHSKSVQTLTKECDVFRPSKATLLLGSGEVAELLLWRDEKKTFSYLIGIFFLFYWFLFSGRTFISSTAKLLLLVTLMLFVHGNLPSLIYGFTVKKIPSSYFEISKASVRGGVQSLASAWNHGFCILRSLAQGNDGRFFLKVAGSVYLLRFMLQFSPSVLVGAGVVILFSVFLVYEQYEVEFNRLIIALAACVQKSEGMLMKSLPGFIAEHVNKSY